MFIIYRLFRDTHFDTLIHIFCIGINMSINYPRILHCIYGLSIFGIGYSLTNSYANHINKYNAISSILFLLDYHIPFIAPTILFYSLSMVWFVGVFFIIPIQDLSRLTNKIILAILISGIVFYYFPLQFSFKRESFEYFSLNWQSFYAILNAIDKPFNQSPSLHIVFAILIAYSLKNKLSQYALLWQILFYILSFLIAISTLFTWQHHLIDIVTGIICALIVIVIEHQLNKAYHQKIIQSIIKYLTIAIVGFLVLATVPTLLNLSHIIVAITKFIAYYWLFSFLLLSFLYLNQNKIRHKTLKVFFYKNKNGQLSFLSHLLFMPLIVIYQIMLKLALKYQFWQQQTTPIGFSDYQNIEIIAMGKPSKQILTNIAKNYDKILYIDMSVELSAPSFYDNTDYLYCPMLDLMPLDNTQYDRILTYMTHIQQLIEQNTNQRLLIVCQCVMGRSRSVAMMGCILGYFNHWSFDKVISILNYHCPNHLATPYLDKGVIHRLANKG